MVAFGTVPITTSPIRITRVTHPRFNAPYRNVMVPVLGVFHGSPMELCLLKFALPINLSLPNGKTFFFQEAGRLVAIETTTNHGTVVFNFERTYTDWTQPGSRVEARHDRPAGSEDS